MLTHLLSCWLQVRIIEAARDKLQKDLKDHARHNNCSLVA